MDDHHDPAYARAPEPEDLIRLCRALNEAGARYVLIGGFAVIAHGGARFTKNDAETIRLQDVPIPVASPATLIRTKDTYREQDRIDRAFLEAVLRQRMRAGRPEGILSVRV